MAKKKLSYDQIAERNLFDPLIKEVRAMLDLLKDVEQAIKGNIEEAAKLAKQTPLEGYDNVEKVEKAVSDLTKSTKDLDKVEKERVRLQERLAGLEDERAKANFQLKQQISERTRALREEAKQNSANLTEYQKLSQRLGQVRKEYKELALQEGRNSKAAKELRKEAAELSETLEQLDRDVKQQFREIGRYENAVTGLRGAFQKLAAATGVIKLLELFGQAIQQNSVAAGGLQKVIGGVMIAVQVFVNRTTEAVSNLGGLWDKLTAKAERFGVSVQLAISKATDWGDASDATKELEARLSDLDRQIAGSPANVDKLAGAYDGMVDEIKELVAENNALIDTTIRFKLQAAALTRQIGALRKEQTILAQQAADGTLSLEDQAEANERLLDITEQVLEKQIQLARQEEHIANERARINRSNADLQREAAEATAARLEAEAELFGFLFENAAERRQILQDSLEQELDILFDVSDRRKSIAESQAADERLSLFTRQDAIARGLSDIESTYQEIEGRINSFLQEAYETRRAAAEAAGVEFNETLGQINIDELLQIEDTAELERALSNIQGLSEQVRNRIREDLIERLAAVNDLEIAQRDLNEATQDYNDLSAITAAQQEALNALQLEGADAAQVLAALDTKLAETEIANLRRKIAAAEEGGTARLELEKELNDLLLEQEQQRIEKENALAEQEAAEEKQRYQQRAERAREFFGLLGGLSDSYFDKRIEAIDRDIDASRDREEQLREAAAQGIQDATENLALQQQATAELERQRQEQIRRQKLAELGLAAIELYAAKTAAGEPNPLASTVTDITLLRAFIESLPGFYRGSERIADDLQAAMPGRDGYVVRVDGGERVVPTALNSLIPASMSNAELARLASAHSRAESVGTVADLRPITSKLDELRETIERKPAYMGGDWDAGRKEMQWMIEQKGKRTRIHRRTGGLFGG